MSRISEIDIFKSAYDELNPNDELENSVIDKNAFDVGVTASSLLGALTGAAIASKKTKEEILKKQMADEKSQSLGGSYYSQVTNIANGLRVLFTPFGVTFSVKNGGREVTLETIETEEMNSDMYAAWQHKDEEYFKHLLLSKMHSDLQLVEQHFAKNFLQNQLNMEGQLHKKASAGETIIPDVEEMSELEIMDKIAQTKDFYGKKTATTEKLAEIMMNILDDGTMFKVSWQLERPIEKYAGLGSVMGFLGFGDSSSDIKRLSDPSYLASKVKIGFMPDRVVYIVDDKIISTLLAMHMDENSFKHFEGHDKNYFEEMFKTEAKKGIQRMNGKIPPNTNIEKKASYEGINEIFERSDIHPVIYFLLLTRKYTAEWMTWDCNALVRILETDFELKEGISDIPLNKILSIQAANRSDAVYTQHHAFEKIIRAFNNKSINFLERETDDMVMEDLAFGLDVLKQVTPHQDIFMNFTDNVFMHMVEMLIADENKIFLPDPIVNSTYEEEFIGSLNEALLDANNELDTRNINNTALESKTIQENEMILHVGTQILIKLRQMKEHYQTIDNEKFVETLLSKMNMPISETVRYIVIKQILKNIEMDMFLNEKKTLLKKQMSELGL